MSASPDPITAVQARRIVERDLHRCVACGRLLEGTWRGRWDIHLRIPRPRRGSDPRTIADSNLVALCGRPSGTKCHGLVRDYPSVARARGLTLWRTDRPWLVPVWVWARADRGHLLDEGAVPYLLDDDGARSAVTARPAVGDLLGISA